MQAGCHYKADNRQDFEFHRAFQALLRKVQP